MSQYWSDTLIIYGFKNSKRFECAGHLSKLAKFSLACPVREARAAVKCPSGSGLESLSPKLRKKNLLIEEELKTNIGGLVTLGSRPKKKKKKGTLVQSSKGTMDLPSLPLDVLRIIFCNPGNSCLNFEDDHGVLVCPVYVLLRLRLVCKR